MVEKLVQAETTYPVRIYREDGFSYQIPIGTKFEVYFNPNNFYSSCKGLEFSGFKTNVICNKHFKIID
jgi:hypothetical protein